MKPVNKSYEQTVAALQYNREKEYWLNTFSGEWVKSSFPYDYKGTCAGGEVKNLQFQLNGQVFEDLMKLRNGSDQRLHMIFAAVLTVLLYRYHPGTDIVLGTPALKQDSDADFINTVLVLRNFIGREMTFKELLLQVRQTVIRATENQNYPVETLPEQLNLDYREEYGFPLFDVALLIENIHDKKYIDHLDFNVLFSFLRTHGGVTGKVEFNSSLYRPQTIERIAGFFQLLVGTFLEDVDTRLSHVELLTQEERQKLLHEFNDTAADFPYRYPLNKTVHQLFREQVERRPANIALMGPGSDITDRNPGSITYRELDDTSDRFARVLRDKGVSASHIAGIMVERSIELVIGMLGILKAGAAYLPIDTHYPKERVRYMLRDSGIRLLVTEKKRGVDFVDDLAAEIEIIDPAQKESSQRNGDFMHSGPETVSPPVVEETGCSTTPDDLFYVIYTSGSTGKPKGVLIDHAGFVSMIYFHREIFGEDSRSRMSQVAGISFDAMAFEIWPCMTCGGTLYFADENTRIDSSKMKEWLIDRQINISYQPTVLAEQLLQEDWPRQGVALRALRAAGDKLTVFPESHYPFRFYNLYGPTESTVWSTWAEVNARTWRQGKSVIGRPIGNQQIYIVSADLRLQPIGLSGELCIGGAGLARGYLNNPELTAEKFIASGGPLFEKSGAKTFHEGSPGIRQLNKSFDQTFSKVWPPAGATTWQGIKPEASPAKPGEPRYLYKTGDLAKWLPDGNIEFLGRIDNQVKIRGFRIELEEIETQLLKHKDIKNTVVNIKEDAWGNKNLAAFIVMVNGSISLNVSEIKSFLSVSLPGYMVPVHYVELEEIPLTPNGKVDRKQLVEMSKSLKSDVGYIPPRDGIEKKLTEIWQDLLDIDKVGIIDNFFNIGGDSIKTINLLNKINKEFNTDLEVVDLYENETIEKFAVKIGMSRAVDNNEAAYEDIRRELEGLKNRILKDNHLPGKVEDIYPLSDIEKGMLFHSLKDLSASVYHNQVVFQRQYRAFDEHLFEKALRLLVQKHATLRSGYSMYDFGEPVHIVYRYNEALLDYEHENISSLSESLTGREEYINIMLRKDREKSFIFNGERPIWRMKTFALDDENICFVWICHHAMIDGWSSASLMTELNNTYRELKENADFVPRELKSSYKDFVIDQVARKGNTGSIHYWRTELADYKRFQFPGPLGIKKHDETLKGGGRKRKHKNLSSSLLKKMKEAAVSFDTNLKDLCFAAYVLMLHMISYENDIVVGLITNNRPVCEDSDKIIGCFLNMVPVRLRILPGISWQDFIFLIKEKILGLKKYENSSLHEIVHAVGEQTRDRNPIVDTYYYYIDFHIFNELLPLSKTADRAAGPGYRLNVAGWAETNTLFDFSVNTTMGDFGLSINYSPVIADEETVDLLFAYFEQILKMFVAEPGGLIGKDKIMSPEEKQRMLYEFNDTNAYYDKDKTIHRLFAEQAAKSPGSTALVYEGGRLSYGESNEISNRWAHVLKKRGVGPGIVVGLLLERSLEMVVGVMAIIKAGGAYLPIDPANPRERIHFMLADSASSLLLTVKKHGEDFGIETIFIEAKGKWAGDSHNPEGGESSTDPAYVIYTSGTTGEPKGVIIDHHSLINRLNWMQKKYPIGKDDTLLQKTPFTFDVSVWELFWWSFTGARLCLIVPGGEKDPAVIIETVERNRITVMHFVPSMLNVFLKFLQEGGDVKRLSSLKQVIVSGEALEVHHVEVFNHTLRKSCRTELANLYGPTEATVDASYFNCPTAGIVRTIPIGKPIDNTGLYILDQAFRLQPVGAPGELCIAGAGLSRGYLNNPELTAEKFISSGGPLFEKSGAKIFDDKSFSGGISHELRREIGTDALRHTFRERFFKKAPLAAGGDKLYRTGDLCRWLPDGEIEFLGRIDHQVKIRGFRIEPEEIAVRLLEHEEIDDAVVTARTNEQGEKYLCAYIVSGRDFPISEAREYAARKLPDYMVPAYFKQVEKIPLTPSGKINRNALPEPEILKGVEYTAPGDEIEMKLAAIWQEELGIKAAGIYDDFFAVGGHSLKAIALINAVHKEFQVDITVRDIFQAPTIKKIAGIIKRRNLSSLSQICEQPEKEYYDLSYSQQRLWYLYKQDPGGTVFNMPGKVTLYDEVDESIVRNVMHRLVRRHESLRTCFKEIDKKVRQVIVPGVDLNIETFDLLHLEENEREKHRHSIYSKTSSQMFDLTAPPLWRIKLIKCKEKEFDLIFCLHHIISDGWSLEILGHEFNLLVEAAKKGIEYDLPPLQVRFRDYSDWQSRVLADEDKVGRAREFWQDHLKGHLPVLNLPYDYSPVNMSGGAGGKNKASAAYRLVIPAATTSMLRDLARERNASLFMVLFAAFNLLLSHITGQEDIVMAIPAAARQHEALKNIIGMFVNTLIIKTNVNSGDTFAGFLKGVQMNTVDALEYQGVPMELICSLLKIKYPDIPVFFNMLNTGGAYPEDLQEFESYHIDEVQPTKFNLHCYLKEYKNGIDIQFHYFSSLFKRTTIQKIMKIYKELLEEIADDPEGNAAQYFQPAKKRRLVRG